ncbi:MAG: type IV pilus assembly protein PilB [Desulforhopalus sp.]|jgi:type IV pilus assembly protein PilB
MTEKTTLSHGRIINNLIETKILSLDQVKYAIRIQNKLSGSKPLLTILKEQRLVSDDNVNEVIRKTGLSIRIGQLLLELGHISEDNLEEAFKIQKDTEKGLKLGEILVKYNFINGKLFNKILSIQLGYPIQDSNLGSVDTNLLRKIPLKIIEKHQFLPVKSSSAKPVVVFVDPLDETVQDIAKQFLGSAIQPAITDTNILKETVRLIINKASGKNIDVDEKTIIGIVNSIILQGIRAEVSDIHIEPMLDRLQVRFRDDGVLRHFKDFSHDLIPAIISRFKILCDADIAEKRRHQGGRVLFDYDEGQVDLRVSFYVTIHGEKIVLRILKQKAHLLDINSIGILPKMLEKFLIEAVYQPSGVLLVTGPTGSGKTSTVYSCINHINSPQISIITAEEPVEYVMEGVAQCSIEPEINRTFKETLRHIVRQDPDVIMIGEIRDSDSAEMAMQSALTGHKVLSTFHTEDSIGGLIRLLNMRIAPFLISSTIVSVLAQRLLRNICPNCAVEDTPTTLQMRRLEVDLQDLSGATFKKGKGCSKCRQTGYRGRIGVFELLVLNEFVRNAILEQKTSHEIRKLAIEHSGLVTLLEDGLIKAAAGFTSIEEVLRCLPKFRKPRPLSELKRLSGI